MNELEDLNKEKNKGWKNIQKRSGGKAVTYVKNRILKIWKLIYVYYGKS